MPRVKPARTNQGPTGWLIQVHPPFRPSQARLYAVIADNVHHAVALVGEYCSVTNERVLFEKTLTPADVAGLRLKPGMVKPNK